MKNILKIIIGLSIICPILTTAVSPFVFFPSQGGTGTSTAPTYGQMLVGNAGGTYSLMATSSLGILGAFSTTSADTWYGIQNKFSTTSTDYWKTINNFYSTTSADYWLTIQDKFSTTSAEYFVHSSTTIPKTYTDNTFTGGNIFAIATTTELCFATGECMTSPNTEGRDISFYPNNTVSEIGTYEQFFTYPSLGESIDESCSADSDLTDGYCDIDSYISTTTDITIINYPLGTTRIRAYTYVGGVNPTSGVSSLVFDGYKRDVAGNETWIGQSTTTEINSITIEEASASFSGATDFAFNADGTDRLVMKVRGHTTSNVAKVIHWTYQTSGYYSHIITPITALDQGYTKSFANETITGNWTFTGTTTMVNTQVTGNVVLNTSSGNTGIGTTTPAYKLTVDGNSNFDSTMWFGYGGSVGIISWSTGFSDGTTRVDKANDSWVLRTGGDNDRIFVKSTGLVGIGTTLPTYLFDVNGMGHFASLVDATHFIATTSSATSTFAGGLNVAGTSGLTVLQNGKVGVGKINPYTPLNVRDAHGGAGGTTPQGAIFISDETNNLPYGLDMGISYENGGASEYSWLQSRATSSATYYSLALNPVGGNVGIGTTTPDTTLQINASAGDANNGILKLISSPTNEYAGLTLWNGNTSKDADSRNWQIASNYNTFGTFDILRSTTNTGNPTTATMSIDKSGNVGIGTTDPDAKLEVVLPIAGSGDREVAQFGVNGGNPYITLDGGPGGFVAFDDTNDNIRLGVHGNNGIVVNSNGYIGIGTTTPATPLSIREVHGGAGGSVPQGAIFINDTPDGLQHGLDMGIAYDSATSQYSWIQSRSINGASYYDLNLNPVGGNVGVGTTTPAMKFSVQGDALADSWNVYSDIYTGDALSKLKTIKPEVGKTGDWVSVDHSSLPEGVLKSNPMSSYTAFYTPVKREVATAISEMLGGVTTTVATEYQKISDDTIISEEEYKNLPEEEKGLTENWTLPTMSISGLTQMNTRAIQQLDEKITKIGEVKLGAVAKPAITQKEIEAMVNKAVEKKLKSMSLLELLEILRK